MVEFHNPFQFIHFFKVGMEDQDTEGDHLTVEEDPLPWQTSGSVVEGMRMAGVKVKVLLVSQIRRITSSDHNI